MISSESTDNDKQSSEDISRELVSVVREAIGPVAAFRNSVCVTALPRTRSGKTARKSIADMAAGRRVQVSDQQCRSDIVTAGPWVDK